MRTVNWRSKTLWQWALAIGVSTTIACKNNSNSGGSGSGGSADEKVDGANLKPSRFEVQNQPPILEWDISTGNANLLYRIESCGGNSECQRLYEIDCTSGNCDLSKNNFRDYQFSGESQNAAHKYRLELCEFSQMPPGPGRTYRVRASNVDGVLGEWVTATAQAFTSPLNCN